VRAAYGFEQTKENVGVYGALMGLVQHDDGILRQVGVNQALAQQHAVRHVLDDRLRARAVLKPNCVADLTTRTPITRSHHFSMSLYTQPYQMPQPTYTTDTLM